MSVAVCLALSLKLLHNFTEGLVVVTVFVVNLATFFFPLPKGLLAFSLSLAFLPCPSRAAFKTYGLGFALLLVTMTGHGSVTGASVVVVTTACKSLYLLLYVLLWSFCLFSLVYRLFIAFAVMHVVATKLVIHFPTTGS